VQARAREFCTWLMTRPERHIAVVSHSEFLYELGSCFGQALDCKVRNYLRYDWENCEMRTFVLADEQGTLAACAPGAAGTFMPDEKLPVAAQAARTV
jgi:hypothetical protein